MAKVTKSDGYAINVSRPASGSDPEIFVVTKRRGVVRSARRWYKTADKFSGITIIHDNVLAEIQPKAGSCCALFQDSTSHALRSLYERITEAGYKLKLAPAMQVSKAELDKGGMEFGCSPAFRFQNGALEEVIPYVTPQQTRWRSAGYHVHMGTSKPTSLRKKNHEINYWERETIPPNDTLKPPSLGYVLHSPKYHVPLAMMMDRILGLFGVVMENYLGWKDLAVVRREHIGYGRAGEFRPQEHGFEYRVLSPWPLIHPALMHFVHYVARECTFPFQFELDEMIVTSVPQDEVESAINLCDGPAAQDLLRKVLEAYAEAQRERARLLIRDCVKKDYYGKIELWPEDTPFSYEMALHPGVLRAYIGNMFNGELLKKLWKFHGLHLRSSTIAKVGEPKPYNKLWTFGSHTKGCRLFSESTQPDSAYNKWLSGTNFDKQEAIPCGD